MLSVLNDMRLIAVILLTAVLTSATEPVYSTPIPDIDHKPTESEWTVRLVKFMRLHKVPKKGASARVRLDEKGRPILIHVLTSTGLDEFDQDLVDEILEAAPFPSVQPGKPIDVATMTKSSVSIPPDSVRRFFDIAKFGIESWLIESSRRIPALKPSTDHPISFLCGLAPGGRIHSPRHLQGGGLDDQLIECAESIIKSGPQLDPPPSDIPIRGGVIVTFFKDRAYLRLSKTGEIKVLLDRWSYRCKNKIKEAATELIANEPQVGFRDYSLTQQDRTGVGGKTLGIVLNHRGYRDRQYDSEKPIVCSMSVKAYKGKVDDLELSQSSGDKMLDTAALDLIRRASPLGDPPGELKRKILNIKFDRNGKLEISFENYPTGS